MTDEQVFIEALFLVAGLLPWWWVLLQKDKTVLFWVVSVYCAVVWGFYYVYHGAPMGVVVNGVELCLFGYGLRRQLRREGR